MEHVLIVSHTEKAFEYFAKILNEANVSKISTASSCGEARRNLLKREYDLVLINVPLKDETGEVLAREISDKTVVILVVKSEYFDAVSAKCEQYGVLTVAKPVNQTVFWSALSLARSAQSRLRKIRDENVRLKQKIEDIRIAERAKYVLISILNMSEQEAHRYLEKQAMDLRVTKREVAEGILKTYEN